MIGMEGILNGSSFARILGSLFHLIFIQNVCSFLAHPKLNRWTNEFSQRDINVCLSQARRPPMKPILMTYTTVADWDILEKKCTVNDLSKREIIANTLPGQEAISRNRMILFRDRNGWCPYSERVWLAMLEKGLDFDEILINLQTGKPSWYSSVVASGTTPAIVDSKGVVVYDSIRILRYLEETYPSHALLPNDPTLRQEADEMISAFERIMPRGTRPSSRGTHLYRSSGLPLPQSTFEETLSKIESILAKHGGPFFLGSHFSIVDCVWTPFLERWSIQAPLLHPTLSIRGSATLPNLNRWFTAMESQVPSYRCRVQGDTHTWTQALQGAMGGAVRDPTDASAAGWLSDMRTAAAALTCTPVIAAPLWAQYARRRGRDTAETAAEDAARRIVQNRQALVHDMCKAIGQEPCADGPPHLAAAEAADAALRVLVTLLLDGRHDPQHAAAGTTAAATARARALLEGAALVAAGGGGRAWVARAAAWLGGRICVPRDMGALPAAEMRAALAAMHGAAAAAADADGVP